MSFYESFENANKAFTENYFLLDTSMLHPQRYHVDVKMKYNMEMIIHHDVMSFEIIHNLNNMS